MTLDGANAKFHVDGSQDTMTRLSSRVMITNQAMYGFAQSHGETPSQIEEPVPCFHGVLCTIVVVVLS